MTAAIRICVVLAALALWPHAASAVTTEDLCARFSGLADWTLMLYPVPLPTASSSE